MKLFEYVSSFDGETLRVKEIEAEEKEKTYKITTISAYRRSIKKDEIGQLFDSYFLNMYLTERDDERYIKALIEHQERVVAAAQKVLTIAEIKLEKYKKRLKQEAEK